MNPRDWSEEAARVAALRGQVARRTFGAVPAVECVPEPVGYRDARAAALRDLAVLVGEAAQLLRDAGERGAAAGVERRRADILLALPWNQPGAGAAVQQGGGQ